MAENSTPIGDLRERVAFDLMMTIRYEDEPAAETRQSGKSAEYHLALYAACLRAVYGASPDDVAALLKQRLSKP